STRHPTTVQMLHRTSPARGCSTVLATTTRAASPSTPASTRAHRPATSLGGRLTPPARFPCEPGSARGSPRPPSDVPWLYGDCSPGRPTISLTPPDLGGCCAHHQH